MRLNRCGKAGFRAWRWVIGLLLLPVRMQAEEPAFSFWESTVDVRAGAGYKDNVLLSNQNAIGSPFWSTGLELLLARLSTDAREANFFLSGEDIRYLNNGPVDKEQTLISQAQFKQSFTPVWAVGMQFGYLYQNQIFDASTTETVGTVRAVGHTLLMRPTIEWAFTPPYVMELAFPVNRQYFRAPLDNYWEGGPMLTLTRRFAENSDASVSYQIGRRSYDTRQQLDLAGLEIPGTSLAFIREEVQVGLRQSWGEDWRWRSTARALYERNRDNGSGFVNYRRAQVSEQLRYHVKLWEAQVGLRFNYYDYDWQTVSATNLAKRARWGGAVSFRAERRVSKSVKLFGEYEFENYLSNQIFDQYNVNKGVVGVDWEF